MAYYITDTPTTGRGRRGLLVTIAVALIVLVGLALLVWPTGGGSRAAAPAKGAITSSIRAAYCAIRTSSCSSCRINVLSRNR